MEKSQLNSLLTHYSGSSAQEAEGVNLLCAKYPYSQVLHSLAARTAKDHNWNNSQTILQLAAVYSTDRSVLKEIMTVSYSAAKVEEDDLAVIKEKVKTPTLVTTADTIDYADEILIDLERLKKLKNNFELMFMGDDEVVKQNVSQKAVVRMEIAPSEVKGVSKTEETVKEVKKKPRKKSKRQRLLELTKELEAKEQAEVKPKPEKKNSFSDPLIDEIKATKKKVKPENVKTKEQIEIITQFIKSKPKLTPPTIQSQENLDLASTLKSGEFGDNIISETLAEILIRQGKKDKAIEVYKKLIWKFPQKKAYFAAQIEELRK